MGVLARLVSWRQHPDERRAQESFLADIAGEWQPRTTADRLLEWRSRSVHLVARLFDGSESLAPIAAAAIPTVASTAILATAGVPKTPEYAHAPPAWVFLLLTIGAAVLAYEAAASPRTVRPRRWAFATTPIAIGSLFGAVFVGRDLLPDRIVVVGYLVLAIGMSMLAALPFTRAEGPRVRLLRRGMVTSGIGLLITVVGDVAWTVLFTSDGDYAWACGVAAASVAGTLLGMALVRARPQIAQ